MTGGVTADNAGGDGSSAPVETAVSLRIDGQAVSVPSGTTIRDAALQIGVETPVMCYGPTITPASVCRLCVVEVQNSRVLVPSCSRVVEPDMEVFTGSDRVIHARKLVLELLASEHALDRSTPMICSAVEAYGVDPDRLRAVSEPGIESESGAAVSGGPANADSHVQTDGPSSRVAVPVKVEDALFVRDYDRCVLCYRCTQACGEDHQFTFAIAVAGRGSNAHIATEFDVPLPDSACVYCGNCIAVCPTGALIPTTEFELRESGEWDPSRQTSTTTVCAFCGVGCNLDLRAQDGAVIAARSPHEHDITLGNLCVKGRFGWQHIEDPRRRGTGSDTRI